MKQSRFAFPLFLSALFLTALACAMPEFGTPETPVAPTPVGDTLSFVIPAYTISLEPGESVPGTRLHYVGREGDAYKMTIDGLEAIKRTGDSFIWSGPLAPGVYANYNLRLTLEVLGKLPVAGPVEILVFNPEPAEIAAENVGEKSEAHFDNVLVNYRIPVGRVIPGTPLAYEGLVVGGEGQQSNPMARLSGLSGYPNFALGDSLVWTGRLRDNVAIRYSLRVTAVNEDSLSIAGTAELWITSE
ncbi:MAG: hypothetical protein GY803_13100 [Chloroflexi bacterium]|nr:hypothetical protein [Chloroflexota bacterium]